MNPIEQMIARGREEGLARGLAKGREEGRMQVLEHQLTLKFGPLPEHVRTRIEQATLIDLEQWLERVLFAGSLDEVFASRQ